VAAQPHSGTPETGAFVPAHLDEIRDLIHDRKYVEAEARARALLSDVERTEISSPMLTAELLDVLVECLWRGGKACEPETRELAERAVAIKERKAGDSDPRVAKSLTNLAIVLDECAKFDEAMVMYKRALKITEDSLGAQHAQVVRILQELGILLTKMGDDYEAIRNYERALEILNASASVDTLQLASVLNRMSTPVMRMGDYRRAREAWELALAYRESYYGRDHVAITGVLNNLGTLYVEIGDYDTAREIYERVVTIRKRHLKPGHRRIGSAVGNLAAVHLHLRNLSASEELFEEALAIMTEVLEPDHPRIAIYLHNLGYLHFLTGEYDRSIPYFEQALDIRTCRLGERHTLVAHTMQTFGMVYEALGDWESALALYERTLEIRQTALGDSHPDVARTLGRLAHVLMRLGEFERSFELAVRAETGGREHLRLTTQTLAEREALLHAQIRGTGLDVALLLVARGEVAGVAAHETAADALVRSRALILDEMAHRSQAVSQTADPVVQGLADTLAKARRRLAALIVHGPDDPDQFEMLVAAASRDKEQAERALAAKSLSFREALRLRRVGLQEVRDALPEACALVSFHVTGSRSYQSSDKDAIRIAERYVAVIVLSRPQDIQVISIGAVQQVDSLVAGWSREAAIGAMVAGREPSESQTAYTRWGEALREAVWDPIKRAIGDAELVLVVPDGALHLVSFVALPQAGRYLIEVGPRVHYLSAERDLVSLDKEGAPGKGLLALGGPLFDDAGALGEPRERPASAIRLSPTTIDAPTTSTLRAIPCAELKRVRFTPLPETAREVEEIVTRWNRSMAGPHATALLREKASESCFKSEAPGKRVLHVATHGFFFGGTCDAGFAETRRIEVDLEPLQSNDARNAGSRVHVVTNPLLLSGLAMAGANCRDSASPENEDGVLMAEEVASLNLQGVEWVVLSACETGIGEVRVGEGVLGLRRAFQVAGAGSIIMSLWAVGDLPTRQWMEALYEARLERALGTAECIHQASLRILSDRRRENLSVHPFYWAGFVGAGQWN
jgi:CHAT domain-containing protein/Tfp pilus assembly protein PilF